MLYGRSARIGLVCLVAITIIFAIGALVIKYKLESFRVDVLNEARRRTGSDLQIGTVIVNGLRGLRVDNLDIELAPRNGPACRVQAPSAYIDINLVDLAYGDLTIDRIRIDGSTITVKPGNDRQSKSAPGLARWAGFEASSFPAFRVTGEDCTVRADYLGTPIQLRDLTFDIAHMSDSPDMNARISGALDETGVKQFSAGIRFSTSSDFDARIEVGILGIHDIATLVPAVPTYVTSGIASARIRVTGYPNETCVVSCTADFDDLRVTRQPEFIDPLAGELTALATYDAARRSLVVNTAQLDAEQLQGTLHGQVDLAGSSPTLDLELRAERWPVVDVVNLAVQQRLQDFGTLTTELGDDQDLVLQVRGSVHEPSISTIAQVAHGRLQFAPSVAAWPAADIEFNRLHITWDSSTGAFSGAMAIAAGTVTDTRFGLTAENLSGAVSIENQDIRLEPFTAQVRGNPISGQLLYNYGSREGTFSVSGMVSKLEETPLRDRIKDTEVAGSVRADITGTIKPGVYDLRAVVDATQADVAYSWWFHKVPGIGANGTVHAQIRPTKSIALDVDGEVASTKLAAKLAFNPVTAKDRKWRVMTLDASSSSLDVTTVGKCLRLPYRITGGNGVNARYEWARVDNQDERWDAKAAVEIDYVELLPTDAQTPIRFNNALLTVDMNKAPSSTGTLTLHVADASLPPFGETWFLPMHTDPELIKKFPSTPREWTYKLQADVLALPPWKGTNFNGTAYTTEGGGGLERFAAIVDEGEIGGTYHSTKSSNAYRSDIQFRNVPVHYFLNHLNYPPVVTGRVSGNVDYGLDRDDPGTLQGKGVFDVRDGQVDTTFFFSQLESQEGGVPALPPALPFDLLHADVEFDSDMVRTPTLQLLSKGLSMNAAGNFIRGGDMDYDLKVAISPETAQRIPVLRESFNIEGHRISQKDIELAFQVSGPTFNPRGQISGLPPASVTFVSGALGITSEAVKLIDTPRRILLDLLKMGGGMLGAQNR